MREGGPGHRKGKESAAHQVCMSRLVLSDFTETTPDKQEDMRFDDRALTTEEAGLEQQLNIEEFKMKIREMLIGTNTGGVNSPVNNRMAGFQETRGLGGTLGGMS